MRALSLLFSLVSLLSAMNVGAQVFCVSTPAQLANAITSAQGGATSSIRLRTGTYLLAATANSPALSIADTSDLFISGGWNSGCTAQTATSPEQTILSAQGSGRLLAIEFPNGSSHELSFSMVSFQNGITDNPIRGGCVYAASFAGANARLVFELVSFRGCSAAPLGGTAAMYVELAGAQFVMRSSIAADNTVNAGNAIVLRGLGNSTFSATNNTVAFNNSTGGGGGLYLTGTATDFLRLTNNIAWANGSENTRRDLFVEGPTLGLLSHNLFGATNSIPAGVTVASPSSGDPLFVGSNLQLRPDSPARNTGLNSAPGGLSTLDFALGARIQAGTVDRGAFEESTMFANGFEG